MIITLFVNMFTSFLGFMFGLLPSIPTTGWGGVAGGLSTVVGHMASLDNWLPFDSLGVCLAVVIVVMPAGLLVKVVRMVISHFTGGGGS